LAPGDFCKYWEQLRLFRYSCWLARDGKVWHSIWKTGRIVCDEAFSGSGPCIMEFGIGFLFVSSNTLNL
jgi:hypothetical protein